MTTLLVGARRKARRFAPELALVAAFSIGGLIAALFIAFGFSPDSPLACLP